jgi:aerobic carbon-monoxide dehydrogenase medium subunit
MKPPPLRWARPGSIEECLAVLADLGEDAKVIAGGQSLMPLLALRMSAPGVLVDIDRLDELDHVSAHGAYTYLGALVRHRRLAADPAVEAACGLLPVAARHIGHVAIRNRGTLGGSLAHADPSAELPAVMVLLGAALVCLSARGVRHVPAGEFFTGAYSTVLAPDELVAAVRLPRPAPGTRYGFCEVATRQGDFARAGATCRMRVDQAGVIRGFRAVFFALSHAPVDVSAASAGVLGMPSAAVDWRAVAAELAGAVTGRPPGPEHGETADAAAYSRRLARTVAHRAITQAIGEGLAA